MLCYTNLDSSDKQLKCVSIMNYMQLNFHRAICCWMYYGYNTCYFSNIHVQKWRTSCDKPGTRFLRQDILSAIVNRKYSLWRAAANKIGSWHRCRVTPRQIRFDVTIKRAIKVWHHFFSDLVMKHPWRNSNTMMRTWVTPKSQIYNCKHVETFWTPASVFNRIESIINI